MEARADVVDRLVDETKVTRMIGAGSGDVKRHPCLPIVTLGRAVQAP